VPDEEELLVVQLSKNPSPTKITSKIQVPDFIRILSPQCLGKVKDNLNLCIRNGWEEQTSDNDWNPREAWKLPHTQFPGGLSRSQAAGIAALKRCATQKLI
jgi:hypothetical protein